MTRARNGILALTGGAVLLVFSWRLIPGASPPLYDGICLVNPYQYTSPPPAVENQPPMPASKQLDVSDGQPGTELITGETPPQATLDLGDGALSIPGGVSRVTMRIEPVAAPATAPSDGAIDGNVYRVEVTTPDGRAVSLAPGRNAEVLLRPATTGGGKRAIERRDGDRWVRLDTALMSCAETQAAVTTSLGDFAVVDIGPPAAGGGSSAGVWLGIGAVAVVATAIVLIRVIRTRGAPRGRARRRR